MSAAGDGPYGYASIARPCVYVSWSRHEGPGDYPLAITEHSVSGGGKWTYSGEAACGDVYLDPNSEGYGCEQHLSLAVATDGSAITYGRGTKGLGDQDRAAG